MCMTEATREASSSRSIEGAFESSWSKYSIAIIAYANASRTKSKDLKHVLREEGTKSHVYRCGVLN